MTVVELSQKSSGARTTKARKCSYIWKLSILLLGLGSKKKSQWKLEDIFSWMTVKIDISKFMRCS